MLKFLISIFQKRRLAVESGAFNIKDKVFTELFPEVVEVHSR